jgi:guanylate kinase
MEGKVLVVTGYSGGVGKDSVVRKLLEKDWEKVVTATDRLMRPGEKEGEDYYFITKEEFKKWIKEKRFYEWVRLPDCYKGIPKFELDGKLNKGKKVVLRVDMRGAERIKRDFPRAVVVWLEAPSAKMAIERMRKRGSTEEFIAERMEWAKEERKYRDKFDAVVVNEEGKLDETVRKVIDLVN